MGTETLKQIILLITGLSLFFIIVSVTRKPKLWKFSYHALLKSLKNRNYLKLYLKLFLIIFSLSLFLIFAYSNTDIAKNTANEKSKNYLGDYNFAYVETTSYKNIKDIYNLQNVQQQ